jgi:hypothetical protein
MIVVFHDIKRRLGWMFYFPWRNCWVDYRWRDSDICRLCRTEYLLGLHVLTTCNLSFQHCDRVRLRSRCISLLNILVLNESFDLFERWAGRWLPSFSMDVPWTVEIGLPIFIALLIAQNEQVGPTRLPGVQSGWAHPRDARTECPVGARAVQTDKHTEIDGCPCINDMATCGWLAVTIGAAVVLRLRE